MRLGYSESSLRNSLGTRIEPAAHAGDGRLPCVARFDAELTPDIRIYGLRLSSVARRSIPHLLTVFGRSGNSVHLTRGADVPVRRKKDKRRNIEPDHDTLWNLDPGWLEGTSDEDMPRRRTTTTQPFRPSKWPRRTQTNKPLSHPGRFKQPLLS